MVGRFRERYQSCCTTYKTYAMTTHHRGAGYPGVDRELDFYIEDARGIDIGPNNDNESKHNYDTMAAFGGSDTSGHLSDILPNSQADL